MQAALEKYVDSEEPLQLLLFVDHQISSRKHIQRIQSYLKTLREDYPFELKVVDVGEQPYLAEHYKLVATPALIKVHPKPRQTLAGSNLVAQLKNWWPRWQRSVEEHQSTMAQAVALPSSHSSSNALQRVPAAPSSITSSIELIRLSDEIFRLKQEKEELLEQLRFKEHVISMLAHDLRSPLTAASIAMETLELEHKPKEGCTTELTPALKARLLKQARSQFRSMERMITDLLESARGNSSEFNPRPKKLQMGTLCEDVLAQMKEQFQLKSQQVETDIPQDLPCVYADEELVRQVLVNLLDNANKYTPVDGKIQVSILHRTTQKIQVSVCDNGPGIPEENRDRIFEGHFRLKRDEAKEGYGLGLSLCQKVIRAHYGRIWVECAPKGGGCFHFTLPIYL
ncbi:histidine kinase [Allocoleopsis franciscana]|uniref:Adaptive-response sensory-kinase SasA n=1 Tax=Allocoleopsis franciscana PCC 7113 TaxID=1173027 RepID=K9WPW2_9CYAN|nr:histidine kinase [Allocoleopsis franciscana]AFZ21846.1 histidine kinase,KaiB domain-containing protein,histidine kinase [Allocoleopsis franciscana PCC 7113]